MNVLVIGSGGREHAIAWKLKQSPLLSNLYVGPGNGGTQEIAENVVLNPLDFEGVGYFCLEKQIDLVFVGPEQPLVAGIVDYFNTNPDLKEITIIGPDKHCAQLEGSKDWGKKFMKKYNIPTARHQTFSGDEIDDAIEYIKAHPLPIVLKADGLAAGKGVIISHDTDQAIENLTAMFNGKFGNASASIVVESFLDGIEYSMFAFVNKDQFFMLPSAKDYKRIGEGDQGLNTGGMGSISPVPFLDDALRRKTMDKVIKPTIDGLVKEGLDYQGIIFFGLIAVNDEPYVIEYNARLGDPETQSIMPRIEGDLLEFLKGFYSDGAQVKLEEKATHCCTTILASAGYPEQYEKGKIIDINGEGLKFHAGTTINENKFLVTNGGRVMAIVGQGDNLSQAQKASHESLEPIFFQGKTYRRDIGYEFLG